jgi:signal transduction histidine kinase
MGADAAVSSVRDEDRRGDARAMPRRLRRPVEWTGDDEDAIAVLKVGGALGIVFLAIFALFDLTRSGFTTPIAGYHAIALAGACLFLGMTWTHVFRRVWKFWTLVFCALLMAMFVVISSLTRDPESRFIAIILCPLATASFVNWGPRWQLALNSVSIAIFAIAETAVPVPSHFQFYRWMGLVAALCFAQCAAIFLERYRRRIRAQLDALDNAARFRELQIATMAHDIRSPVAALAGYAHLLEEGASTPAVQRELLDRIGSTAWNMNLVVSNVLDLYRFEEDGRFHLEARAFDPNEVIAEAAEDCAMQARRKGRQMQCAIDRLPPLAVDRHDLDAIVRNLAACALECTDSEPVRLSAHPDGTRVVLAVEAPNAILLRRDLDAMTMPSDGKRRPEGTRAIGWFLTRAMAEAAGGRLIARTGQAGGFSIAVEIPFSSPRAQP